MVSACRLDGRIAIVTGGSSGIGQAIVQRLAAEGATVAIADIADCSETVSMVEAAGGKAISRHCDLADHAHINEFVDDVTATVGAPSILVHNAVRQFLCPIEKLTPKDLCEVFAINVEAAFYLTQACLPAMKQAQWGRIIVMASSTFFVGAAGMAHYVSSKGALIGFVRGLAHEVGEHGITVNAVAPGLTRTAAAVKALPESWFQQVMDLQSIKRSGRPEDQAGVIAFLASEDASFITGQTLLADGGQGHN